MDSADAFRANDFFCDRFPPPKNLNSKKLCAAYLTVGIHEKGLCHGMTSETILIKDGVILAVDLTGMVYERGSVLVENDRILAVGETGKVEKERKADRVI